nr:MAG TPA: hypothetical protein [Inoviridae sp.]
MPPFFHTLPDGLVHHFSLQIHITICRNMHKNRSVLPESRKCVIITGTKKMCKRTGMRVLCRKNTQTRF